MSIISESLEKLIHTISKLPGLGPRSAQRIALHLLKNKGSTLNHLVAMLQDVEKRYAPCITCGYFDERSPCFFCTAPTRDPQVLCVVADTGDVWALERSSFFKGRYHVLGGVLSAFSGVHPEDLMIEPLLDRLADVKEVILALDGHMEGQTTMHYLAELLEDHAPHVTVSSLARGIPMGGELSYLDQGTLMSAFVGRKDLQRQGITS